MSLPARLCCPTSENSVKAKFAEFPHQEDMRCMLAFLKSGADFLRGCAHPTTPLHISMTHPRPLIREWPLRKIPKHCSGLGSCRIAVMLERACNFMVFGR
jgi:hypothetical protein